MNSVLPLTDRPHALKKPNEACKALLGSGFNHSCRSDLHFHIQASFTFCTGVTQSEAFIQFASHPVVRQNASLNLFGIREMLLHMLNQMHQYFSAQSFALMFVIDEETHETDANTVISQANGADQVPLMMNHKRTLSCFPTLMFGAVLTASAAADITLTTADGRGADNQVMGFGNGRESLNKGGASQFEVRGHEYSGNNYYGVLRFDLAEADLPEAASTASLTLTVLEKPAAGGRIVVFGLQDGYAGGPDSSGRPELAEDADEAPLVATGVLSPGNPVIDRFLPRLGFNFGLEAGIR